MVRRPRVYIWSAGLASTSGVKYLAIGSFWPPEPEFVYELFSFNLIIIIIIFIRFHSRLSK